MTIESGAPQNNRFERQIKDLQGYDDEQFAWAEIHALAARTDLSAWIDCVSAERARRDALAQEPPTETPEP